MTVTSCAHRRILYAQINHPSGTCSDRWECELCGKRFGPLPEPSKRKVTKTLSGWVNMFAGEKYGRFYATEQEARNQFGASARIACVHMTGTYEVEE